MHSHTNYFIDVTTQKMRLSDAKAVAEELVTHYQVNTIVDTILCLDGMEVVGTCIAELLTKDDCSAEKGTARLQTICVLHHSMAFSGISPFHMRHHML
jgi:hypothetical protein